VFLSIDKVNATGQRVRVALNLTKVQLQLVFTKESEFYLSSPHGGKISFSPPKFNLAILLFPCKNYSTDTSSREMVITNGKE